MATDLARLHPAPSAPIEVIYNAGFDDAPLPDPPDDLPEVDGTPLLVSCGRLVTQKAPLSLVEAIARSRHRPRLWMLGDGPLRPVVERRVAELGLASRVRVLGFRDDPRPYLAAAQVFVSASRYEGFGNVLVEAMACGTPVVATDCPWGPAEILDSGKAGILAPPGDIAALAQAIDSLLDDPARSRELAARGRARAQIFHPSVSARRHGEVFDRLAGR